MKGGAPVRMQSREGESFLPLTARLAHEIALSPYRSVACTGAPTAIRASTISACPSMLASMRDVQPSSVAALRLAPADMSGVATAVWPSRATKCSAVQPSVSTGRRCKHFSE